MSKNTPQEDKEPLTSKRTSEPDDDISQYYPDGDYESMEDDDETYQALLKKKQKNRRKRGRMTRSQRALSSGSLLSMLLFCLLPHG